MFFIAGTKNKKQTVGQGQFFCPHCQTQRQYERKTIQPHFSLYFIPILPIGEKQEIIECMTCHMQFVPRVLDINSAKKKKSLELSDMINRLGDILRGGKPIEYLVRDMVVAGLDNDAAWKLVHAEIGDRTVTCPECQLTYADNVTTCSECERELKTS